MGSSEVRRAAGGCALREHWTGTDGFLGTSLTARDPATRRWRQTWLDNRRQRIEYTGGPRRHGFEFSSDHRAPGGKRVIRLTLWPEPPGRIRQKWEQSADGGKSWRVDFDGTYSPAPVSGGSDLTRP
ncbi:MAG: hypothetical protein ABR576_16340 [Thermoanaerobaculia bacterium]